MIPGSSKKTTTHTYTVLWSCSCPPAPKLNVGHSGCTRRPSKKTTILVTGPPLVTYFNISRTCCQTHGPSWGRPQPPSAGSPLCDAGMLAGGHGKEREPGGCFWRRFGNWRHQQIEASLFGHVVPSSDGHKLVAPHSFTPAQIGAFFLAALAATQIHHLEPLAFLLLSVFMERHRDGHAHYHVPVLANKCFRFMPLKRQLLQTNGLATHWSCSHERYASCIAYCYLPSQTKPMEQLDPSPWLWAAQGEHPRLFEACQAPITSEAWAKPCLRNLLPCEAVRSSWSVVMNTGSSLL